MALREFIHRSLDQHYECMVRSVAGLTHQELAWNPDGKSTSIGFLVWHYARTLDRWINSRVLGVPQLWDQGWADKFGRLPPDSNDTGYGFTVQQVQEFQSPSASIMLGYALAAKDHTLDYLDQLDDDALESRMIANPRGGEISLSAMFQQLIWESNQHGGQIAYLRGLQRGIEDPAYSGGMLEAEAGNAR